MHHPLFQLSEVALQVFVDGGESLPELGCCVGGGLAMTYVGLYLGDVLQGGVVEAIRVGEVHLEDMHEVLLREGEHLVAPAVPPRSSVGLCLLCGAGKAGFQFVEEFPWVAVSHNASTHGRDSLRYDVLHARSQRKSVCHFLSCLCRRAKKKGLLQIVN